MPDIRFKREAARAVEVSYRHGNGRCARALSRDLHRRRVGRARLLHRYLIRDVFTLGGFHNEVAERPVRDEEPVREPDLGALPGIGERLVLGHARHVHGHGPLQGYCEIGLYGRHYHVRPSQPHLLLTRSGKIEVAGEFRFFSERFYHDEKADPVVYGFGDERVFSFFERVAEGRHVPDPHEVIHLVLG